MNRKKLALLGGVVLLGALALRRRGRRDAVEIEIDDRRTESVTAEAPGGRDVTGRAEPGDVTGTAETKDVTGTDDGSTVELEAIEGIGAAYAERLRDAGIDDGADLATAEADELAAETGIGERRIRRWQDRVGDTGGD